MTTPDVVKKLSETSFKLHDLVVYANDKHASGGVIYQIVEDTEPVKPASRSRAVTRNVSAWDHAQNKYVTSKQTVNLYGSWDANGKKISYGAVHGFIRIKPLFDFFATDRGKKPRGKGQTVMVYYRDIERRLELVDLVLLGTKYLELGNIMRDIARSNGMIDVE